MASHMRGQGSFDVDDPFSQAYVDPALTRKERARSHRDPQDGGRGWTLLYLLAALGITLVVWFVFGQGV